MYRAKTLADITNFYDQHLTEHIPRRTSPHYQWILKLMHPKPGAYILIGDGENLPWPDNYFDYVTSLGSLEHYLHPEIGIREIKRVLKTDGLSCIMLPNRFSLKDIFRVMIRGGLGIGEQDFVERAATKNEWIELIEKTRI